MNVDPTAEKCPNCDAPLFIVPCTGTLLDLSGYGTAEPQCDNCGTYGKKGQDGQVCDQTICSGCQMTITICTEPGANTSETA